jgi:competence protein ComFC
MFKTLSQRIVSLIFPLSCEVCGDGLPARSEGGVCAGCAAAIPRIPSPRCERCGRQGPCLGCSKERFHFDRTFAACYYGQSVKSLLCAFKFRRHKPLKNDLLKLLEEALPAGDWDGIAAVPMHTADVRERGFNQAELLARGLSKKLNTPFLARALAVKGRPARQSSLRREAREANVKDRFRADGSVAGKRVLLVDDVMTTGSTASECARALKEAGALGVDALVVARVP